MKHHKLMTLAGIAAVLTACNSGSNGTVTSPGGATIDPNLNTNQVAINVTLPTGTDKILNTPFVAVTVCQPGTGNCQTINNIILDTGSMGLRLFAGALNSNLNLTTTGLAECTLFGSGYDWGSLKLADVKMGGEVAGSVPIQIINDPAYPNVPTACSSSSSYNDLGGANGIIGVNALPVDEGSYYKCTSTGSCTRTTVNQNQKVVSPVYKFAQDNNGVIVNLPEVPVGGSSNLQGTLTFGINTQDNNQLPENAVVLDSNASQQDGSFTTTYGGSSIASIFDTGSTEVFFNTSDNQLVDCGNDNSLSALQRREYSGFYCPTNPVSLNTVLSSYDGSNATDFQYTISNFVNYITANPTSAVTPNAGATGVDDFFIWGLPFFYGTSVYVGFNGANVSGQTTPFFAYKTKA